MEKSMLLMLLVFSGLNILPSSLSVRYEYVKEQKTWFEAQRYCREHFTDLATIYDKSNDPFKDFPNSSAWIGLSSGSWMWSLDDEMLDYNYTNFDKYGIHSTNFSDENAICEKMGNRTWNNISCSLEFPFVCYDKTITDKYVCISQDKTWEEAQSYCRTVHTDLVSLKNQREHDRIFEKLNKHSPCQKEFCIGLSRVKWQWSDQSVFHFQNWLNLNPHSETTRKRVERSNRKKKPCKKKLCNQQKQYTGNDDPYTHNPEQCVEMSTKSRNWKTKPCNEMNPFICYDDELVLVQENKTWVEALNHCREKGWDLVSVHSAKIQHLVQRLATNATTPYVWLGLRYNCTLQVWFWVSDHGLCYQNWAQGHGGSWAECKTSGAMPSEGPEQWEGKNQAETFNFICTRSPDGELDMRLVYGDTVLTVFH